MNFWTLVVILVLLLPPTREILWAFLVTADLMLLAVLFILALFWYNGH